MITLICPDCENDTWSVSIGNNEIELCCQICGETTNFTIAPKPTIANYPNKCRDCDVALLVKVSPFKPSKLKKPYYYTHTLKCPECKKMFLSDKYKIIN